VTARRELVTPDLAILARRVFTGSARCTKQIPAEPADARAGPPGWCWRASRPGTRESRWR